jgi:hypothetical protein
MFSVLPERGRDNEDSPSHAQFRLIGTAVMGDDLVGMRGGDGFSTGYNPFDLYGAAERKRGKPLPPHLVFAELDEPNSDDACAFLNAYGPLEGTSEYLPLSARERKDWKKLATKSPQPEEHFRSTLNEVPLLPNSPVPQNDFYRYPLSLFWKSQSEFELTLRLYVTLHARTDRRRKIQQVLAGKQMQWDIEGHNSERQYTERARQFVMTSVQLHLSEMRPRIAREPNSATGLRGVWGCYSLLEAMYLMLFLDIAGWSGRITQCEKCHTLFWTTLDKGKYCSPVCENQDRSLRAYHRRKGDS